MPATRKQRRPLTVRTSATVCNRKILFVIPSLDVGGTERHLTALAQELVDFGWRPVIYCIYRKGLVSEGLSEHGINVVGPPIDVPRVPVWRPHALGTLALSAARLFRLMAQQRPTIIHFFLPAAYLIGGPLSLLLPIRARIMSRRSLNNYQKRWPVARWIEPFLHKRMSVIVPNSQAAARQLIDVEGCSEEKIKVIYNGVDMERYKASGNSPRRKARETLGLNQSAFVAVSIANLIPYKGHADLIRAYSIAQDNLPKGWQLLCVGRDDGLLEELKRLVSSQGLSAHIAFKGPKTDIVNVLHAADIGLLCSHEEGFSNSILEGMAARLPMIVTDVGGNPEAVLHRKTGLVVPPKDPVALSKAITLLASEPERARRMGAAGQHRAQKKFAIQRCINEYHTLYTTLTDEPAIAL